MNEQNIIASCIVDRDAFTAFQVHGGLNDLSPLGQFWLKQVGEYYDRDTDAKKADYKLLKEIGCSAADFRHKETLSAYYEELPVVGVSSKNVVAYILTLQRHNVGIELANLLLDADPNSERVKKLLSHYNELQVAIEVGLKNTNYLDYDSLENVYDADLIVPLHPKKLRDQLMGGGALPGHTALIFGRPEAGKSLLAISMATYAAFKGKRVLYCGNEEAVATIGMRIACNLARRSIRDFQEHYGAIKGVARNRGLDNITVMELAPGTFAEIQAGVQDTACDLLVIDQLTGVDVGESGDVRSMDKAARSFRSLVKSEAVVGLAVSQAGDRTEKHSQLPPAFLSMSDVYGSRTGIPAQMDLMVGIGYDEEMYERDQRAISLPKNKLGGTHERFMVSIDKFQSRVY
jgi:hypothetical protein